MIWDLLGFAAAYLIFACAFGVVAMGVGIMRGDR